MKRFLAACMLSSILAMILIGVVAIAVTATSTPAEAAGPCRCPLVYAPVVCDHGKTYPNPCVAECHNATNCVPTGGL
jgi:hypothetical protein